MAKLVQQSEGCEIWEMHDMWDSWKVDLMGSWSHGKLISWEVDLMGSWSHGKSISWKVDLMGKVDLNCKKLIIWEVDLVGSWFHETWSCTQEINSNESLCCNMTTTVPMLTSWGQEHGSSIQNSTESRGILWLQLDEGQYRSGQLNWQPSEGLAFTNEKNEGGGRIFSVWNWSNAAEFSLFLHWVDLSGHYVSGWAIVVSRPAIFCLLEKCTQHVKVVWVRE